MSMDKVWLTRIFGIKVAAGMFDNSRCLKRQELKLRISSAFDLLDKQSAVGEFTRETKMPQIIDHASLGK